ncbi:methionyl-tRNA formyltransferase [Tersicoccus phoenicis]|uniref:Methionyl-tRNA formyltransferase n=1 Tax=Tersicoccus phoenicis TaxID=554083 RepID=A0A1R1LPB6_9MICC|nr:methionyl-tRNA formyltransferase [Tersicoccus phoenicis]OMH29369.1 methionyl-tRNA formyltransferase [Tersicoccus phoenicis]
MRVLFAGTPDTAADALGRLHAHLSDTDDELVGVLTRPDAPLGRKRVLTPSPVAAVAVELGLPVIKAARVDGGTQAHLADLHLDVAVVVAYGALIPAAALDLPRHGWLNLHFSLLPAYRGAAPVQRAIIDGRSSTGASVFALRTGLDTGPVYGTVTAPIGPTDTTATMLRTLTASGTDLLAEVLEGLSAGTARAVEQAGDVTSAPKLTLEDGRLDWTTTAAALDARSRGVTPEPGAWTTLDGGRVKLGPVRAVSADADGVGHAAAALPSLGPGVVTEHGRRVLVGAGDGVVVLSTVQPAGRTPKPARDWWRGVHHGAEVRFA